MADHPSMEPGRRRFLALVGGWGAAGAALVVSALGSVRFLVPNVHYTPSARFKIHPPDSYPEGVTYLDRHQVFLVRRGRDFRALSSVCTHLGCSVTRAASGEGFHCPCHGSRFDRNGQVLKGPAPRPLPWLAVEQAPDGRLVIDRAEVVQEDEVLTV